MDLKDLVVKKRNFQDKKTTTRWSQSSVIAIVLVLQELCKRERTSRYHNLYSDFTQKKMLSNIEYIYFLKCLLKVGLTLASFVV